MAAQSSLGRRTFSTQGPGPGESRSTSANGGLQILNPSKEASAFTQSYEVKRETKSSGPSIGDASRDRKEYDVLPITKVEVVPSDTTTNPKHIYINISAQNNLTGVGIPAQFQIDFDQPYLKNSEKYYLTIAKATFPTSSIPLFTFRYDTYGVTLQFNGAIYNTKLRPVSVIAQTDGNYYIYYYQQFIDAVNVALMSSFNNLVAADSTFTGTVPPYFVYNKPTNRFSLITQEGIWYSDLYTPNSGSIFVDYQTYRLFNGIPGLSQVVPGSTESTVVFITENTGGPDAVISNGVNPLFAGGLSIFSGDVYDARSEYQRGVVTEYKSILYASITNTPTKNINKQPDISPLFWEPQGTLDPAIWRVGTTYVIGQIVYYPTLNSVPFISLVYPNLANVPDPAISIAFSTGFNIAGQTYSSLVSYSINQLAYYSGTLYASLQNANLNNQPDISPAFWVPVYWKPLNSGNPTTWLPTATYEINQNVYYPNISSGIIYTSRTNANTGNNPVSSPTNWMAATAFNANNLIGEYSTLSNWSDIESIVIQTGTLPIRYEIYAPPQTDLPSASSASQVPRPVLTDLDLIKTADGFDRSPVQYVPNGPYRMIDLFARDELKRIDAFIQYKHKDLSFTDLIMLPGDYFAIKFLLIRNDALTVT